MPDGAPTTPIDAAIASLDRAIRELGPVQRLDRRHLAAYTQRGAFDGWRLTCHVVGRAVDVDVLVCDGFPWLPVILAVADRSAYLLWPHIERDGLICQPPPVCDGSADRAVIAMKTLLLGALKLVETVDAGKGMEDFRDEFSSYWSQQIKDKAPQIVSICDPNGPTRQIYVSRLQNWIVAADDKQSLVQWLTNAGYSVPKHYAGISDAVFVRLGIAPLPRQYPQSGLGLIDLVRAADPAAEALIRGMVSPERRDVVTVLGVPTTRGSVLAGVLLNYKGPAHLPYSIGMQRGFRPGRMPPRLLQDRYLGGARLTRLVAQRADSAWVHGRDHDPSQVILADMTVVIAGCGSVGAAVAVELAKSGVGNFALLDHERLTFPNTSRHALGARYAGWNKAKALADYLKRSFPDLKSVAFKTKRLEHIILKDPALLADASLIVEATADSNAQVLLNHWQQSSAVHPPILYGWTEEHACAGHAVALYSGKGCLNCVFKSDGTPHFTVTHWPSGDQLIQEAGCGAQFQPYGSVELSSTCSLLASSALDILLGYTNEPTHRIWATRKAILDRSGGKWSEQWIAAFPDATNGGLEKTRPLTALPSCACQIRSAA